MFSPMSVSIMTLIGMGRPRAGDFPRAGPGAIKHLTSQAVNAPLPRWRAKVRKSTSAPGTPPAGARQPFIPLNAMPRVK